MSYMEEKVLNMDLPFHALKSEKKAYEYIDEFHRELNEGIT